MLLPSPLDVLDTALWWAGRIECLVLHKHTSRYCRGRIDHTVTRDGRIVRVRGLQRMRVPAAWSDPNHDVAADMRAEMRRIWDEGGDRRG